MENFAAMRVLPENFLPRSMNSKLLFILRIMLIFCIVQYSTLTKVNLLLFQFYSFRLFLFALMKKLQLIIGFF